MIAYQPFLSDHEAEAIRIETAWRHAMATALEDELLEHRKQSAILAWIVGACLVGLVGVLCALVWAS